MDTQTIDASAPAEANYAQPARPQWDDTPEVTPARAALVKKWAEIMKRAEKHWQRTFDRMKKCRQLARDGAYKDWLDADSYVVPIIPRHINTMVSALYAKDPRAVASPRKKLLYTVWDGTPEALAAAANGAAVGDAMSVQLMQEVQQVKAYMDMVRKLGKTLELCWQYFTEEQKTNFKSQMKALVRRTKINGVGFVKLGYQRILGKNPEITAGIQDVTSKIAAIQARLTLASADKIEEDSAEMEQLQLSMKDLQDAETIIVREGPIFDFPRSDEILYDWKVRHIKTFAGAKWMAHKFDMTPEEILETYKIDVKNSYTRYYPLTKNKAADKESVCRVWEVQDSVNQQTFVLCDGYPDFLKEPCAPDVKVDRFWTLFALVFNEVESDDDEVYPPSDVWLLRHPQAEYNRARQGLREHRAANRPKYVTPRGALEEKDHSKLTAAPAHSLIEVDGMVPGDKIGDKIQRVDMVGIDPNQYQVDEHFKDALRAVGSQEANMGPTSGGTATETSIAENGRQSSISDNVDELDDFLSDLVKATGQLMLIELSSDTVKEIAGPGASWPDHPMTRDEISKDLLLSIRAGSSGRPNQAAEVAKLERAAPYLMQIPGISPEPLARRYADLLEIDMDELYVAGLPSITAQNAAHGKQAQAGTGDPANNPADQGGKGGANAKDPQDNEPGAQPAYPAPAPGGAPAMQGA